MMDPLVICLAAAMLILLFLTGAPIAIAFCMGSSIVALFVMGMGIQTLSHFFFSAVCSYPLLACPFFILAGELVVEGGAMNPLRDFMNAILGHVRGGLAVVGVAFAAFLGTVSGSSAACLAILGTIMLPIMVDAGYDRPFTSGLCVVGAELGLMIPPSIFFVLFGAATQISIADLFLAGLLPGILCAIIMGIVAVIISIRRRYPTTDPMTRKERGVRLVKAFPVVFMPILVLGGIYGGIFSPTQAAAVGCFYTVFIGVFVYRNLTVKGVFNATIRTIRLASMIYLIVIGADIMSRMFGYLMLPQILCDLVLKLKLGPLGFLLVVQTFLVVLGAFFISLPTVVAVLPLFMPTVEALHIDPIHYAVIGIFACLLGELVPPVGEQLWLAVPICQEKLGAITKSALPFMLAMTLSMLITTFVPDLATFLVKLSH
jgi:C4-dicarboxylate transporter DctM subunit